jgi:hypothetical protein
MANGGELIDGFRISRQMKKERETLTDRQTNKQT